MLHSPSGPDFNPFDLSAAESESAIDPMAPEPRTIVSARDVSAGVRGQTMARTILACVVTASLLLAVSAFGSIAALPDALSNPTNFSLWTSVLLGTLVAALGLLLGAIISTVRSRPRLTSVVALILSILLPPLLTVIGVKLGVEIAWGSVQHQVALAAEGGSALLGLLSQLAEILGGIG